MTSRLDNVLRALDDAHGRLKTAAPSSPADGVSENAIADALFPPLGETLIWLRTAHQLLPELVPGYEPMRLQDRAGLTLPGLGHAANKVLHGTNVAAVTMASFTWGSEPGRLVLGRSALGTVSGWRTQFLVELPDPERPDSSAAYKRDVGGREALPLIAEAIAFIHAAAPRRGA